MEDSGRNLHSMINSEVVVWRMITLVASMSVVIVQVIISSMVVDWSHPHQSSLSVVSPHFISVCSDWMWGDKFCLTREYSESNNSTSLCSRAQYSQLGLNNWWDRQEKYLYFTTTNKYLLTIKRVPFWGTRSSSLSITIISLVSSPLCSNNNELTKLKLNTFLCDEEEDHENDFPFDVF